MFKVKFSPMKVFGFEVDNRVRNDQKSKKSKIDVTG